MACSQHARHAIAVVMEVVMAVVVVVPVVLLPVAITAASAARSADRATVNTHEVHAGVARTSSSGTLGSVEYFGFWDPDAPTTMAGFTNIAFCDAVPNATAAPHASGIACLFQLEPLFLRKQPNGSLALRPDYNDEWGRVGPAMCAEVTAGRALGFFLGDELVSSGLWFGSLGTYADTVKSGCPAAVVYYNEGFAPVFEMGQPWVAAGFANVSRYYYPYVPLSLDWISFDLYPDWFSIGGARDFNRWTLWSKMAPHQRAVLVPPAYGDKANATVTAGDCDGLDCDAQMSLWATAMSQFAAEEDVVVALMPYKWRYASGACDGSGRRCVGAANLPQTRQVWESVGRQIVGRTRSRVEDVSV